MRTGTVVAGLVLPAGSVAVTWTYWRPSPSGVTGVTLQVPSAATVAVLSSPPGNVTVMVSPATPVPLMVGVVSLVVPSPLVPVSLASASTAAGAAGGAASSVKPPAVAGLVLPAVSVTVVLVLQAPSCVRALPGTTWLIVNGPLPVAVPPCDGGRSAAVSTVLSVVFTPLGFVTTVVTVSPTFASAGSVVTIGVPPALAASAAFTPWGASGSATAGADGAWVSSAKLPPTGALVLPATSASVVLVVQTPSTDSTAEGTTWLIVKGPLPVAVPPCEGGRSAAVSTVLSVVFTPFGFVTTVVTVSPTFASAGSVVTMGDPPELATSAAFTPCGASGSATAGADGAWMSSVKPPAAGALVLPATSVSVVLVVQTPSTDSAAEGTTWLIVKGPLPVAVPPCDGGRSVAVSTVLSVVCTPLGLVTTVVTVSPTFASAGNVTTIGVPLALAASVAFTP